MATILARAAQNDLVRGNDVPASVCDSVDGGLERRVLERLNLAAVVAHEVVVMVAVGVRRLEPGDAVAEVDPLDEPQLVHAVERAVHAGDPDVGTTGARALVDLLRGEAAVLLTEALDDDSPSASAPPARVT